MNIVVVDTNLMHPPTGGCQTFLEHLVDTICASGHHVDVVTEPGKDSAVAERLDAGGARLHPRVWQPHCIPEDRASRLADWVSRRAPDAFVVSLSRDAGWLVLPLLDPSIVTAAIVHNDGPAFYRPLTHYAPYVDRAVGVSAQTHRAIVADCGVPPERAEQIPYGVPRLPFDEAARQWSAPRAKDLRIGFVGRVEREQKRVQDIPLLLTSLDARGVEFRLDIVGDGSAGPWLRGEIGRLGLEHRVHFHGWLAPAEVRRRLLELEVLLMLSDVEGLPLALLEAMGHAVLPVVTRTRSGNPEVIRDGDNGFLLPVGDIDAFADRLEELASSREVLRRGRELAWRTSEDYGVGRMAGSWLTCLERKDSRAPRPAPPFPVMDSCRSPYPAWARRLKWRLVGPRTVGA